jgi:hypothetical protein
MLRSCRMSGRLSLIEAGSGSALRHEWRQVLAEADRRPHARGASATRGRGLWQAYSGPRDSGVKIPAASEEESVETRRVGSCALRASRSSNSSTRGATSPATLTGRQIGNLLTRVPSENRLGESKPAPTAASHVWVIRAGPAGSTGRCSGRARLRRYRSTSTHPREKRQLRH